MSDTDDGSEDDQKPSPGASDPGEPGYEGEVTVGDDGFEGIPEEAAGADAAEQGEDR
jgi:hypothetical protein